MHELLTLLQTHARGVWRFRWFAVAVAWAVAIAGSVFVYSMPDQYDAHARIYVDTQSTLRPLLRGLAVEPNMARRVQLMARTLLSTPNLQKIARQTDLDLRAKTPEAQQAQLKNLQHEIKLGVGGRDDLYTIDYSDYNPLMAKRVVQAAVNLLMESTLGNSREDSSVAQSFLSQQRKDYEARLRAAEQRLANFKKTHIGMMPDESGDYYQRLQTAMSKVEQTKSDLVVAQQRVKELQQQVSGEQPTFGIMSTGEQPNQSADTGNSFLEQRIQADEDKLDSMLLRYTNKHPDVIALKAEIARLKKDAARQRAKNRKASASDGNAAVALDQNPVYQNTQIQLNDAKANVAALQGQLEYQQQQVQKLKKMVDTIPEVEAQLARLNRDYTVTKTQYQKLLSRLDTARLSQEAQNSGDKLKFRIIDPPTVPLEPTGPDRALFLTVVFLASLAAGIGFAIFLHLIRPVFMDRRTLREFTGRPVLGTVTLAWSPSQQRHKRRQLVGFALAIALLVAGFGGAVAFNQSAAHLIHALLTRGLA